MRPLRGRLKKIDFEHVWWNKKYKTTDSMSSSNCITFILSKKQQKYTCLNKLYVESCLAQNTTFGYQIKEAAKSKMQDIYI